MPYFLLKEKVHKSVRQSSEMRPLMPEWLQTLDSRSQMVNFMLSEKFNDNISICKYILTRINCFLQKVCTEIQYML